MEKGRACLFLGYPRKQGMSMVLMPTERESLWGTRMGAGRNAANGRAVLAPRFLSFSRW